MVEPRRDILRLCLIGRPCSLLRVTKSRTLQQHLIALPPRQVWEANRGGRTPECEKSVTIDAGEPCEHFRQRLAAHAFDRITPEGFDSANSRHRILLPLSPFSGTRLLLLRNRAQIMTRIVVSGKSRT